MVDRGVADKISSANGNVRINQVDTVVPSLNTLYSQKFKGSIGYQAATEVIGQGLSGSNSYIMNL